MGTWKTDHPPVSSKIITGDATRYIRLEVRSKIITSDILFIGTKYAIVSREVAATGDAFGVRSTINIYNLFWYMSVTCQLHVSSLHVSSMYAQHLTPSYPLAAHVSYMSVTYQLPTSST